MPETYDNSLKNDSETNSAEVNYEKIQKFDEKLANLKNHIISTYIVDDKSIGLKIIAKAGIPSFILVILSFFIGIADVPFVGNIFNALSSYIRPGQAIPNTDIQPVALWWFPFIIYLVFAFCAYIANKSIKKEMKENGASEASITRIIDRYSGIVDGIGTALPLLGAAILLISIEKGPAIFLGFAVPFEIKSIIILAIAKLFDSVFDTIALKYQEVQEKIKNAEKIFFYQEQVEIEKSILEKMIPQNRTQPASIEIKSSVTEDQLKRIFETMKSAEVMSTSIKNLVTEINNLKMPDEKILKELEATAKTIGETVESLKDSNVLKSLDNLVYISGKR